jgi:toxin YoeB
MYKIVIDKTSQKEVKKLMKNDKLFKRFLEIIEDMKQDPYSPSYKFERLTGNLSGYYSKRLSLKDRIIYRVDDQEVIVYIEGVLGHYDD